MKTCNQPNRRAGGFTLVEITSVIAALAVLTAGGIFLMTSATSGSENSKLRSQVAQLNAAIRVYEASGGSMAGQSDIADVLGKLKSVADEETGRRLNGLRGSMIDSGLVPVMQSDEEASGSSPRALWNTSRARFEIADGGAKGVKWFAVDPDEALVEAGEESRGAPLLLASSGGWVWDYTDFTLPGPGGPNEIGTSDSDGGGGENDPFPDPLPLNPPTITTPGGQYDYTEFPMTVYLQQDNPPNVSHIIYSMGGGVWETYDGGAITVPGNTTITAYAVSDDWMNWMDSTQIQHAYLSTFVISGDTSGDFSNPNGGNNMITGGEDNYFTWGTPGSGYTDPSWLLFNGSEFSGVSVGQQFVLGDITYHNGTINSGTGAMSVDLAISLAFGGATQILEFGYELELINTPNHSHNTPEESADYVKFGDTYAEFNATLGGIDYTLSVEFGETTESGFSSIDEFFVFEGEIASGTLYGTLLEIED